mmetsp:Transcript_14488/g.43536  ORF Transcript_14488/g.43536 Transcript_14488/m.43536 type:complete len:414 (-) Transcript_14488:64-1305(-)
MKTQPKLKRKAKPTKKKPWERGERQNASIRQGQGQPNPGLGLRRRRRRRCVMPRHREEVPVQVPRLLGDVLHDLRVLHALHLKRQLRLRGQGGGEALDAVAVARVRQAQIGHAAHLQGLRDDGGGAPGVLVAANHVRSQDHIKGVAPGDDGVGGRLPLGDGVRVGNRAELVKVQEAHGGELKPRRLGPGLKVQRRVVSQVLEDLVVVVAEGDMRRVRHRREARQAQAGADLQHRLARHVFGLEVEEPRQHHRRRPHDEARVLLRRLPLGHVPQAQRQRAGGAVEGVGRRRRADGAAERRRAREADAVPRRRRDDLAGERRERLVPRAHHDALQRRVAAAAGEVVRCVAVLGERDAQKDQERLQISAARAREPRDDGAVAAGEPHVQEVAQARVRRGHEGGDAVIEGGHADPSL